MNRMSLFKTVINNLLACTTKLISAIMIPNCWNNNTTKTTEEFRLEKKSAVFKKFLSVTLTLIFIFTLMGPITNSLTLSTDAASIKIKTQSAANGYFNKGAVKGIDVSKWQGGINWSKVAGDDIKFAFIRASYGTDTDPYFVSNAQAAHKNGVKVGAYHYARFKNKESMKKEAAFFISQLKKVKITYPVVLHLEAHHGLNRAELTKLALDFIKILEKEGYSVMLYSYQNFIDQRLDKKALGDTKLWVANYIQAPKNISHKVWQHTSVGRVNGISGHVDINVAYEDLVSAIKKGLSVNKSISDSIHEYLNSSYGSGLEKGGSISITSLNKAVMTALQKEISALKADGSVITDGQLTSDQIRYLASLDLSSPNNSKIVKLLQSKIFYTGIYKNSPSGSMDMDTKAAVKLYQQENGITASSVFCEKTISKMFGIELTPAQEVVEQIDQSESLLGEGVEGSEELEEQPSEDIAETLGEPEILSATDNTTPTVTKISSNSSPAKSKVVSYSMTGEVMDS